MTGKDKHMPLYSSSDIEKYLSGELSDPEMHAMERAALDDPFLADALEGMTLHRSLPEQPSFQQDIDSLQKRLDDRVSRKKSRLLLLPLPVRYAAAVILMLGIGATAWYTLSSKGKNYAPLAASKVEVPTQQPPAAPAPVPAAAATDSGSMTLAGGKAVVQSDDQVATQYETELVKKDADRAIRERKADSLVQLKKDISTSYYYSSADKDLSAPSYKNNVSNLAKQPAAPSVNNNNVLNNRRAYGFYDSTKTFRRDSLSFALEGVASGVTIQKNADLDVLKKTLPDQLVFTGKVLNTQHLPIPGATLSFKTGQNYFNTVTDANGNFMLRLPKYDTSRMVAVNYIGYEQGYMTLNTDDKTGNVIFLRPQTASLNEVVVVGYGAKRKELTRTDINSVPPPPSQTAVPAEGWSAYTNYLELNKNSPQIDTTIRGYESISFIVNKKGELSNFKVERSLSPAHDSLAIRLVKEGPSWKLLKGKKEKARVILTW